MRQNLIKYKVHIIVVLSLLCLGELLYGLAPETASATSEKIIIIVKPGMVTRDVGDLLYSQGGIKSVFLFQVISKMQGLESSLQAGEYVFSKNMTMQQIVSMLAKGETFYLQMTIPEGYTVEQIAKLLQEKQLGSGEIFKTIAKNYAPYNYMVNANSNVVYKAEGYIFPNTYRITQGATEEQILSMMTTEFDKQFNDRMRARASEMGLSIKDVMILASLVEKEAQLPGDRPIIAGVFINRLKQGMPLQSCATIQYILGYPKAELSVQDTEIPSPYNTYQHMGLPPGPIANPGLAAINAVLYPQQTDYLYFVADKKGAHHFTKTYEEHLNAIEQVNK